MKQKTLSTLIFILAVVFVVTALASVITKLVPKNENGNISTTNKPSVIEPIREAVTDVNVSPEKYTFIGIG